MSNISEVCQTTVRTCLLGLVSQPKKILCPIPKEKCEDKELTLYGFRYSLNLNGWQQLIKGTSVLIKRYKVDRPQYNPPDIKEDTQPHLPKSEIFCEKDIC